MVQTVVEQAAKELLLGMYVNPSQTDMLAINDIAPMLGNVGRYVHDDEALEVIARGMINVWWSGYERGWDSAR